MNFTTMLMIFLVTMSITACATKRYPIATPLSPTEAKLMTCHDLELELLRADQVELKINETGEFDGKTVLGFFGDLGIGNGMAKEEARTAVSERKITIHEAQVEKGCLRSDQAMQEKPATGN